MSRYVDLDELIYCGADGVYNTFNVGAATVTLDIVFCADCRHCGIKTGKIKGQSFNYLYCTENNRDVDGDDYCSWGERA